MNVKLSVPPGQEAHHPNQKAAQVKTTTHRNTIPARSASEWFLHIPTIQARSASEWFSYTEKLQHCDFAGRQNHSLARRARIA